MPADLWIFGYGSLIWRTGFEHLEHCPARADGFKRRFWQGSADHRGTPEQPGRVVTLLREPGAHCWGMAFRIAAAHVQAITTQLDLREQGGYERWQIPLQLADGRNVDSLTYVATRDNPEYLGPAEDHVMVRQILDACGPSGRNIDYLLNLNKALSAMGVDDPHVSRLAAIAHNLGTTA